MKRLVLSISMMMALAPGICNAQLTAGKYFVGGAAYVTNESKSASSGSTTTKQPGTMQFGITPEAGYMLTDQWALMLGIGYTTTISNNQLTGEESLSTASPRFSISPRVRRFLFSGKGGLFVDGRIDLDFVSSQTKRNNTVTTHPSTGFGAGVDLGAAYFISDRLMLTGTIATVSFRSYTSETATDNKTQTNSLRLVFNPTNLSFGLTCFF
jgi:long-subunit fatty acid transport protein